MSSSLEDRVKQVLPKEYSLVVEGRIKNEEEKAMNQEMSKWEEAKMYAYFSTYQNELQDLPIIIPYETEKICKLIWWWGSAIGNYIELCLLPLKQKFCFHNEHWIDESYANPDSGGDGGYCTSCGWGFYNQMY